MNADDLIKRMRAQRMFWVELEPGKKVQLIRPTDNEVATELFVAGKISTDHAICCKFAVGWSGITEADLLGESAGASDPVPFDSALWAELSSDRMEWIEKVGKALLEKAIERHKTKEEAEKN